MPSREEERSKNRKSDLRYCPVHKCYYYQEFGCQQCALHDFGNEQNGTEKTALKKCPKCSRNSLFYNDTHSIYECLNKKCKALFTPSQLTSIEIKTNDVRINSPAPKKKPRNRSSKSKKRW